MRGGEQSLSSLPPWLEVLTHLSLTSFNFLKDPFANKKGEKRADLSCPLPADEQCSPTRVPSTQSWGPWGAPAETGRPRCQGSVLGVESSCSARVSGGSSVVSELGRKWSQRTGSLRPSQERRPSSPHAPWNPCSPKWPCQGVRHSAGLHLGSRNADFETPVREFHWKWNYALIGSNEIRAYWNLLLSHSNGDIIIAQMVDRCAGDFLGAFTRPGSGTREICPPV